MFIWKYMRCYWRYVDNSVVVILHTWCQIQRTSSGLRYVNCGPGHIQSIFSTAYLGFNIQLWASALQLFISRQFNVRYTANLLPNTAHILQFTLCDLWSRPYTKYLQLRIFNPEYSSERICAAVGDMPIFACMLYRKFCAKYRDHPQVCAVWTVVPDIYNAFPAPHIQTSMFIWTYLRCYWRYLDNSIVVILQTWCQIHRTSSGLHYVNCGPGHIQSIFSTPYVGFNIQL
jgi:hypothetical protein